MMSKIKRFILPFLYHNLHKRLFNDIKNKIKVQIAERTKMFIGTYAATLASNGWSLVNKHPLLNMMYVFLAGKDFLGAIDSSRYTKDANHIANVIKRYLIEAGP